MLEPLFSCSSSRRDEKPPLGVEESPAKSRTAQLRSYNRVKLGIAAQLRSLMELLKKRADDSRFQRCEELMSKLAEDRFILAVVGQFKRGKSSLMNAIIGRELLPVGVRPLTSAITVLKFGPIERLVVQREGLQFSEVQPVERLADFVTEWGNPANCKRVKTATLEMPLPFLRRGLEFVDTPGVGSPIEANTATTHAFLPECDAALFVTSVDSPLHPVELDFLHTVREHAGKIFYIVNKTDLCGSEDEQRKAVDLVTRTIREQTDSEEVRVYPVSARLALAAKTDSSKLPVDGGLEALEEALSAFLSHEKASVLLAAIIDRAVRLLDEESGEVNLFKKSRALLPEARGERLDTIRRRFHSLAEKRKELLTHFRADLAGIAQKALAPELDAHLENRKVLTMRYLRRMVARAGWRLSADLATRCGEQILKRTRAQTNAWLREQVDRLRLDEDEAVATAWRQLVANVNELSRVAHAAFGLSRPPAADILPAWHIVSGVPSSALRDFVWNPSSVLQLLPVPMVRRLLASALRREAERLVTIAREDSTRIIEATVAAGVDIFATEVAMRAAEIEARIVAAITGSRLPRRMPSSGMELPEMAGWGEGMLESIRANFATLRERVRHLDGADQVSALPLVAFEAPSDIRPPKLRETEISIDRRLTTRGCPVCDHLADLAFNLFAEKQYALYLNESVQAEFAASHGFCPLHLWQLYALTSPEGASVGLARLVEEASRVLSKARDASGLRILVPDANSCSVCARLHEEEHAFIERLALFLQEPESRQAYARSQGVCLRHLAALATVVANDDITRFLLVEASRHFEEMGEDMQHYAIKRTAMRSPIINANELDAAWRSIVRLAGSRNVCAPWRDDGEI